MSNFLRTAAMSLAGATLLCVATPLAASAHGATTGTYLYDCSTLTQRPSQITLACADANRYLSHITWSAWAGHSVHAKGTLHWNTCTPTCAGGTMKSASINFVATGRKKVNGTWLFTELKGPKSAWGTGSALFALPTSAL
jgi:hypothetical protein